MNKPSDALLSDLLDKTAPSDFRQSVLSGALKTARRRKHQRLALQMTLPVFFLLAVAWWMFPIRHPGTQAQTGSVQVAQVAKPEFVPGTSIQVISDEELLAHFKDLPCALVGPPGQRQFVLLDRTDSRLKTQARP